MIKIIAILLNLGWAFFFLIMGVKDGSFDDSYFILFFALVLLTCVVNLLAFVLPSSKESWFRLWLKRKSLEEKTKISKLKNRSSINQE